MTHDKAPTEKLQKPGCVAVVGDAFGQVLFLAGRRGRGSCLGLVGRAIGGGLGDRGGLRDRGGMHVGRARLARVWLWSVTEERGVAGSPIVAARRESLGRRARGKDGVRG